MRCQSCTSTEATRTSFRFHIGMIIERQAHVTEGTWCRACLRRRYWSHQAKNATLGWWGYQSFFATWWFLCTNTWSYVKAVRALPTSPAPACRTLPAAQPR
jgi:hypothetical protein